MQSCGGSADMEQQSMHTGNSMQQDNLDAATRL
jgi:hypothetical protein